MDSRTTELTFSASTAHVVINLQRNFAQALGRGHLVETRCAFHSMPLRSALGPAHLGFARLDEVPDGLSFPFVGSVPQCMSNLGSNVYSPVDAWLHSHIAEFNFRWIFIDDCNFDSSIVVSLIAPNV